MIGFIIWYWGGPCSRLYSEIHGWPVDGSKEALGRNHHPAHKLIGICVYSSGGRKPAPNTEISSGIIKQK